MKIFVSWSGGRSRAVAEALRDWLPLVLPDADPWMSASDIHPGVKGLPEISEVLNNSNLGIICLTRENITAPWILFEAGALSKTLRESLVCPYLLDLVPTDVKGPLAQFQAVVANNRIPVR